MEKAPLKLSVVWNDKRIDLVPDPGVVASEWGRYTAQLGSGLSLSYQAKAADGDAVLMADRRVVKA